MQGMVGLLGREGETEDNGNRRNGQEGLVPGDKWKLSRWLSFPLPYHQTSMHERVVYLREFSL
jgi:hypothetical protein